jgi:hypothetical protein
MKNVIPLSGICACLFCNALKAQESVNAGGGNWVETNMTVAYSLGQVFYEPVVYSQGSVTPGVQQPYETPFVTVLSSTAFEPDIQVAPNPATDLLHVFFPAYSDSPYTMTLLDLTGKNLYTERISNETSRLPIAAFAPGVYFLQIKNNDQAVKVFKIIKQ